MGASQALLVKLLVGLAKHGQRRVEGPRSGLDQFGLDSYIDPDLVILREA
jgi:hypothetical protein